MIFHVEWFCCMICLKIEGKIRTGCELRLWTIVMLASLPHAVNSFSKTSDEYYFVVAFLHWNMLQAVQSVQYTCRQNKYPSQSINVTFDGSCNRKNKISSFCSPCTHNAYHFFTNIIIFVLKWEISVTRLLESPSAMHPYHYHLPNTIHLHHLRYTWNITQLFEQLYKRLV